MLIVIAFAPRSIQAEVPELAAVKERRYVMRAALAPQKLYTADGFAGLWAWLPEKSVWERLIPLAYGDSGNGEGASLAASQDRIILQGTCFLEFDVVTHRLLRRYAALPPAHDGWAFKGTLITDALSRETGLPPGYYGYPHCPPTIKQLPYCPATSFPGMQAPVDLNAPSSLIYRRGIHPADSALTLVQSVAAGTGLVDLRQRFIALDAKRSRFWFVHRTFPATGLGAYTRFGYLPFNGGSIGEEVVLANEEMSPFTTPRNEQREPLGLAYDPVADQLLLRWKDGIVEYYATTRPATRPTEDTRVASGPGEPVTMTTLAPGLPDTYEQLVAAIGKAPGANGTNWRTDLWLFNPSAAAATVRIRRVTRPEQSVTLTLPARGSRAITDVLGHLGGGPAEGGGDGVTTDALVATSPYRWGEQLSIVSRTYTGTPGGNGTYGQAVPAMPHGAGYSTHTPKPVFATDLAAAPPEFYLDHRVPGQFRHNFGVVNDEDEALTIDLFYDFFRTAPGLPPTRQILVPPHSVANVNLESLFGAQLAEARPTMFVVAGSRPAPLWLSMVDNKTGDATFVPFATFGLRGALDATMAIPAVAHTPGAHGSFWRTDIYGRFDPPQPGDSGLQATLHSAGAEQCQSETRALLIGPAGMPGHSTPYAGAAASRRVYPDVVSQFGACTGTSATGALEVSIGSWMAGFSRTYTTREDGGTYGEMLPFYPVGGWPVQHFAGIVVNSSSRVNVGLYNGLTYPVTHRLTLHDAAGAVAAEADLVLEPKRSQQLSLASLFRELPSGLYGLTVNPVAAEGRPGRSWAYVSVVDNVTGDPVNYW